MIVRGAGKSLVMSVPRPAHEEARLQELHRYELLDSVPEKVFDDIARMAARICHTPYAFVTLIDQERQWFKARFGLDVSEIPRDLSFCAHTILTPELMQVTDASLDPRFQDNSFVIASPHIRFYAGVPLISHDGHALGTLFVIDHVPRTLSEDRRETLKDLSRIIMAQFDVRRAAAERERQLQMITDNVPLLISRVGHDFRYTFANQTYQEMLQVSPDRVIGHTICDVLGETAFAAVRPYAERALAGERVTFTAWIPFGSVGPRYNQMAYIPEFGAGGDVTGFLVAVMDITERKHAEMALRERTEVLESVLATIPHLVFWKDRASVYLGCNPNFAHTAGVATPADVIGKRDHELPARAAGAERYQQDDRRVIESGIPLLDQQQEFRHEDGTITTGLTSKLPLRDAEGRIVGVLGISQDISEHKALEDEREHLLEEMERLLAAAVEQADRDPLTGLLNHRTFHKRLEEETERAERTGTTLAVAMLDLDHFKFFNDTYGHPAGDDVLRRVAQGLSQRSRPSDTVARFGGDKFALLMPGLGQAEATQLTQRLVAGLDRQGYVPPGHDVSVPLSLSLGVAVFPTEAAARLEVLDLAAARLRVAKTGGDEAAAAALDVRATMSRKVEGFSMLDALVAAVDNKDRYTRRHSEDVLAYSVEIARRLGLDEKTQHTIAVAALLHDVGKIGVPDRILRKPGKLTDEEFEAMRQHPMMGAIIVGAVPGFEETLDAVRHHHERWDGGGYPFGLRGEECPLVARLMAVADAYSAMTTDRPYRKGMGAEKALAILRDGAGTQWDPVCVAAFLHSRSEIDSGDTGQ